MPKTDLELIKETAKAFLYIEPTPCDIPFFTNHPFFDSQMIMKRGGGFVDIYNDKKGLKEIQKELEQQINSRNSVYDMLFLIRPVYHLTFLKYIKPYLDKRIFDKLLAYMWVNSENPNQDVNVDIPTLIEWFSVANKHALMNQKEFKYFSDLPDEVDIYRGVAVGREEKKGLSWTCNLDKAKWFAQRFDNDEQKGYILRGKIKKDNIFAYFNSREEDEVCCNSSKIYDLKKIQTI